MFVLASLVNFYGGDLAVDYQKYFVTLLIYNVYQFDIIQFLGFQKNNNAAL